MSKKRIGFGTIFLLFLIIEVSIAKYGSGWLRNHFGDVLVMILIYAFCRMISPQKPQSWHVIPCAILAFSFVLEFLQLWGFCDKLGITNKLLRIVIGTQFSLVDLVCYVVGIMPCYIVEYLLYRRSGN